MEYRLYKEEDFKTGTWSGGEARQLAIFPEDAGYDEREFVWRLSSAAVTQEESAFTMLPDYDRVLMVLEGDVVLVYEGERVVRLKELEQDRFDGGYSTKSFGKIRDYELMVRKGSAGYLDVLKLSEEKQVPDCEENEGFLHICQAFYCHEGYGVVTIGSETCMVSQGQQLVVWHDASALMEIGVMGEGTLIRAQIFYGRQEMVEEAPKPELESARGTFADFRECMKLSMTNFRGSKYLFKSLKNVWYDEGLKQGIHKIERLYLPMMLWIFGIAALGAYVGTHYDTWIALCVLLGWSLLVLAVLSPLLYFLAVPKPVKAHIKKLEDLTEREKEIRQEELDADPARDRILKKYKTSSHSVYVEEEERPRRRKKR